MKNKLKIYTVLLAVVLVAEVFTNIFHYESSSYSTDENKSLTIGPLPEEFAETKEIKGGVVTNFKPTMNFNVKVKSNQVGEGKYLVCNSGKKSCYLSIQKAKISIPFERMKGTPLLYTGIFNVVIFSIFGIWGLIIAFKLIRSVYKGEVFVAKVARQLETIGGLIIGMQLLFFILGYATSQILLNQIDISYLAISWDYNQSGIVIIFGLTLMVVSQIILRGKELQEEQELTI